ncbi:hypothetical protein Aph02nite_83430 [Actinoplanes philippinensis]|uniref:EVE domain-containing protein n=1 Tax=Actinoplanes philippinensis TaxID=35752 RepID=A0A1I2L9F2_9ACTN|nr:hypothetical protein [Actinoplanes philippinensis]GIE82393.1 hypothetical protein Aph02nite_83430 [Actinoplanes philippinensis]SFF75100.1 hypothetical protein SAMN05421541_120100 [Actinoplanes philippinensis]
MTDRGRLITATDLGAWLIRGNADRNDLLGRFAREPRIDRWCVRPGYRLDLTAAGQPVLFWGSGSRRRDVTYGVWGRGRLLGPARPRTDGDGWELPLDLTIAAPAAWTGRDELRAHDELAGLEVLRQPQGANPSFLTKRQFAALRAAFGW